MRKFVTAVNCMDGRVQEPVISFMKEAFDAIYVDMITEPGPDGILSARTNEILVSSIRERLTISLEKHASEVIGVFSHGDCAGNPVDKNRHVMQTMESVSLIKSWFPETSVYGYWIDENWIVNKIE